jgi:hypothetical protein
LLSLLSLLLYRGGFFSVFHTLGAKKKAVKEGRKEGRKEATKQASCVFQIHVGFFCCLWPFFLSTPHHQNWLLLLHCRKSSLEGNSLIPHVPSVAVLAR